MARLINKTKNIVLAENLKKADGTLARMKGLLGRNNLSQLEALHISRCNSIHTFFMKFAIDVVFVDKNLKVKSIFQNVKPWKMILPIWGANSVFEFASGTIQNKVDLGDHLDVGH